VIPDAAGARILIVDDDPTIRDQHSRLLVAAGYEVESASDGVGALAKLPIGFDLVLLDAEMPHVDGYEVARSIREHPAYAYLPIVIVTGQTDPRGRKRATEIGVNDFIFKPIDPELLKLRCRWLVEFKRARDRLDEQNVLLRRAVERQTASLREALEETSKARRRNYVAHLDTIRRLTIAAEYKDTSTGGHIERIGRYSEVLGRTLGMTSGETDRLRHAAPMHDVGKLGIPDAILLKPGKLDDSEMRVMRSHTTLGAEILSGSPSRLLQLGETIALTHHERWDGAGYPKGLSGEDIPIEGRICAIVDFFDALSIDRPYRAAVPHTQVFRMMEDQAGGHFDPHVLGAFMRDREEFLRIQSRVGPRG
jgi:putative two-component system response regulator